MNCDYYSVYENGTCIAQNLSLEHALLFLKALFERYWSEPGLSYAIMRQTERQEADE